MAALLAAAVGSPALAASEKMYSYVPADRQTQARVDQGLTIVFDKGLLGFRVKTIMATQAHAQADLDPASERDLHAKLSALLPKGASERELYAVQDKEQGLAMVRAFCPGSTKGWLVFSAIRPRTGAVIHALGDDPKTGRTRYCATLNLDFRGEWTMPENPQATPNQGPLAPQRF